MKTMLVPVIGPCLQCSTLLEHGCCPTCSASFSEEIPVSNEEYSRISCSLAAWDKENGHG